MWVESLGWEDPLEEETATHSYSCLRNPTEEPAGLYSPWVEKQLDTTETLVNSKLYSWQGGTRLSHIEAPIPKTQS